MGIETAIALAGLGMSAYQGIKGAQATAAANSAAEQASQNLARIQEQNKMQSLQVPTLGTELAQQNLQARQAATIQGLQQAGPATVLGGLTVANQQAQAQDLQLAAQADEMQYQRDAALAQNAQQLEQNRVQRELGLGQMKLTGAQAAAAEGRQMQNTAIAGGLEALSSAAQMKLYRDIYGKKVNTPQTEAVNYNIPAPQDAFRAQISTMAPKNVQIANPGLNQMKANMQVPNYMASLRGAQSEYDASQLAGLRAGQGQFDTQYQFDPYNYNWTKK